ncbi:Uncharacterised protein [Mycolicibacterium flavescens]|nr:hypothetical protein [Mycobacterium neumannii]VEG43940.1 Uncharacterised protein [Mycolicibacterium flavescens]
MSAEQVTQRIAAMDRELTALIAESFDTLGTAEQLRLIVQWRRSPGVKRQ